MARNSAACSRLRRSACWWNASTEILGIACAAIRRCKRRRGAPDAWFSMRWNRWSAVTASAAPSIAPARSHSPRRYVASRRTVACQPPCRRAMQGWRDCRRRPAGQGGDASTLPPGVIAVNVWSDSADEAWGIGARNSSGCPVRSFGFERVSASDSTEGTLLTECKGRVSRRGRTERHGSRRQGLDI